ncbi:flavin-dependent oxidoreductase [Mucilaginibacter calamicampi]|uniref:Flavin-dependent oxidoreductase n=1 Tax=Mucilaginibacter calamicampi TaxID=1302352 RepID=A0ABW2Z1W0_9SPHI
MNNKKIVIAGGGIGGLTAALSLHNAGFDVSVYESTPEIKPLGVGINLLPHAVRVLTNLGLQEAMADVAVATRELIYFNKFGQKIWGEPRGMFAGYNWPQFSVHRGTFQMLLLQKVKDVIGADQVFTGHHLQFCENTSRGISAVFTDKRSDRQVTVEADALIGADGIHSVVRKQFYPVEGIPKFSGIILHRGTTIAKPFLSGSSMIMAGSRSKKFVAYPITKPDKDGNQLINWIADLQVGEEENIMVRDWNRRADKEKLLKQFQSWEFSWLNIPSLINNAEAVYEFPMSDRDPLPRWTFDRITLLGDAAHPMYPIGSNGASQAILDAECLTECLHRNDEIETALKEFEGIRLPATSNIVLQNRKMGPEEVMQIVEERAPDGFENLYDIISQDELDAVAARYKKIAGFEMEALNQKH